MIRHLKVFAGLTLYFVIHFVFHFFILTVPSVTRAQSQPNTEMFDYKIVFVEFKGTNTNDDIQRLRIRNQITGTYGIINLQKQPTSANIWFGYFSLPFVKGDKGEKILEFFDADGKKLYVFSDHSSNVSELHVFESSDELNRYSIQFSQQAKAKAPVVVPPTPKQLPVDPAALAALAAKQQAAVRLQEQQQEQIRVSLEESLALQREQQRKAQEALDKKEKKRRKDEAVATAAEALKLYRAGNYTKSVELYEKASQLDPENESYYYQYGVALYKIDNYNKSLAILSLAEDPDINQVEKSYYIALNHMKLKEYDKARKEFVEIRDEEDPTLSPMGSFFAGNIEMQQQKYPEARKSFEYTIDHSNDPKLDKTAEELLEQLDRLENFLASQKERFRITLNFGTMYDTNVLNISNNNFATETAGYRANYGITLLTNIYRTMESELGVQLAANDYYSVNKNFGSDSTLQAADPLVYSGTIPFKGQSKWGEQQLLYTLTPTYNSIVMNPDGSGRRQILASSDINGDITVPIKQDFITKVKLDYSSDKSYLNSKEDDSQSNKHYSVTLSFIKLMDPKAEKSWMVDLYSLKNNADGKNNRYTRNMLSITHTFPGPWKSAANVKLDLTNWHFLETDSPRTDNIWALGLGGSKDLKKNLSLAVNLQTTNSNSQNELYTYNKYLLLVSLTHVTSIQKQ